MNVVVTGATGFIGSHVVRELLRRGHTVAALVRPGSSLARLDGVEEEITTWRVDLADGPRVEEALARIAPDAAIHLGWYAEPGAYLRDVARNVASLEDSLRLVRLLRSGSARRLVLAGTCLEAVPPQDPVDEPIYAVAKRAMHQLAVAADGPDLRVACAHIFSVHGPHEDPRRAVPSVVLSLLDGTPVEVGVGGQLRDYVHVADVADALVTVVESDVRSGVDICTGDARPLRSVFEELGRATGAGELIRFGARLPDADQAFDATGDPTVLRTLGWRPRRAFPERIAETVEWWRAHRPVPSPAAGAGITPQGVR
jgi:nucleoside-diphosphate-sugar epimerase